MPQMVVSLRVIIALLLILFILVHIALYYATGFNLIIETINFLKWLIEGLKWLFKQVGELTG